MPTKPFGKSPFGGKKPDFANFNFGRMAEDIMATVMKASSEGGSRVKGELEKLLGKMEMVSRREFDAVREIAIAARQHAEELAEHIHGKKTTAQKSPVKKTAAKKTTAKKPAAKKATTTKKPAAKKAPVKKVAAKKTAKKSTKR